MNYFPLLASSPEAGAFLNFVLSAIAIATLYAVIKKATSKPSVKGAIDSPINVQAQGPINVKMEDHFVTRREFDGLRASMAHDLTKLESLQTRLLDKIDERDLRLTDHLEKVASGAYNGRVRLHKTVNKMRDRVVRCETKLDIPVEGERR